ncbi:MAG TPA: hypothetical protein VN841_19405 [Bryobacteraceae bacterium]|nr:hypothetical protein [Bryobacteraceae bacterium]
MRAPEHRLMPGILLATAAFAMVWAIARAAVQSITIDEAVTYLAFVRPGLEWWPGTNNHLLNSLLMRLFTLLFGPSHLSVRAPALIGAALYISASYRLCRLLGKNMPGENMSAPASSGGSIAVAWPLLVCLVYNPFVFDYLVAARGYGLALGFLMWAIVVAAESHIPESNGAASSEAEEPRRWSLTVACAVSSACAGLSFAANLTFAFVDFCTLVAVFLAACIVTRRAAFADGAGGGRAYVRLLAACSIPALIVTALLPASIVLRWPKGELWYGANSLGETFLTLTAASLYQLNSELLSPFLYRAIDASKYYLWPLLGVVSAACVAYHVWPRRAPARPRNQFAQLATALAAILTATLAIHWLCFRVFHLLLPKDRTGIYVVPLTLAMVGAVAALPTRALRRGLIAVLFVMAGYFLLCMRLQFFKDWQWDADVKDVYPVLACLDQDRDVRDVATFWMYATPLNFYRVQSGRESLAAFDGEVPYRPEQRVLVLNSLLEADVLATRGLKVLYHGKSTDVVIAATPDLEPSLKSSACLARPWP